MTEIRLRPHASLHGLAQTLQEQEGNAQTVVNGFDVGRPKECLAGYLQWINVASRTLGNHLQRTQLEQLLHTRHYWALRQMDGTEAWLTGQVEVEINARREAFLQMAREAAELYRRWEIYGAVVMPDTNVLVHTTEFFDDLDWPTALAIFARPSSTAFSTRPIGQRSSAPTGRPLIIQSCSSHLVTAFIAPFA